MPGQRWGRRGSQGLTALVVAVLASGSMSAAAQVSAVDLQTDLGTIEGAVPGAPSYLSYGVSNLGATDATGVTLTIELPAGVEVVEPVGTTPTSCAVSAGPAGTTLVCDTGDVPTNNSFGYEIYLAFEATGSYTLTASATADQPELDASGSSTTAVVVDEEADLRGSEPLEPQRALIGQPVGVAIGFYNAGPTAAVGATVTGEFPSGATLVPGTFHFGPGTRTRPQPPAP